MTRNAGYSTDRVLSQVARVAPMTCTILLARQVLKTCGQVLQRCQIRPRSIAGPGNAQVGNLGNRFQASSHQNIHGQTGIFTDFGNQCRVREAGNEKSVGACLGKGCSPFKGLIHQRFMMLCGLRF